MNTTKKNNLAEIVCFILFCISTIFVTIFHEPWLDELQAWAISKDSIANILFLCPHYEVHPPLWHLILKIFSSLKFNCELGIRIPNLLFMFAAIWLLIFKSPFPKIIKLSLPFTFFLFYQYSVLSRPYSVFCFAMFLTAILHKQRNEHPYKYISALALLCLSSVYGMAVTTGIVLAWGIECLNKQNFVEFLKTFVKTSKFKAMLIIFFLCLVLAIGVSPAKDTFATNQILQKVDYIVRFIYSFFIFPADALFYNFLSYMRSSQAFTTIDISDYFKLSSPIVQQFWIGAFLGLGVNILFVKIFKNTKNLLQFLLPFGVFCTLVFLIYAHPHHIGLLTIFYIYAFWALYPFENDNLDKKLKGILYKFVSVVIIIQIFWNCSSCISEYLYQYSPSRVLVNFIKQNNLQDYKIMSQWYFALSYVNKRNGKNIIGTEIKTDEDLENLLKTHDEIITNNFLIQGSSVIINAYFDKNIIDYYNVDNPNRLYIFLKTQTSEEAEQFKQIYKQKGLPDIIIGTCFFKYAFTDVENPYQYYDNVLKVKFGNIWKNTVMQGDKNVYIRHDILERLKNERNG